MSAASSVGSAKALSVHEKFVVQDLQPPRTAARAEFAETRDDIVFRLLRGERRAGGFAAWKRSIRKRDLLQRNVFRHDAGPERRARGIWRISFPGRSLWALGKKKESCGANSSTLSPASSRSLD